MSAHRRIDGAPSPAVSTSGLASLHSGPSGSSRDRGLAGRCERAPPPRPDAGPQARCSMEDHVMRAIVVFESHWGNTEAVARAIAQGIGPEARALTTAEATPDVVAEAELVVAGAPVMAFSLPSEAMVANSAKDPKAPVPADITHPTLRAWLEGLPHVDSSSPAHRAASFETRLWWSPGGATGGIETRLRKAGFNTWPEPRSSSSRVPTGRSARVSSSGPGRGARSWRQSAPDASSRRPAAAGRESRASGPR